MNDRRALTARHRSLAGGWRAQTTTSAPSPRNRSGDAAADALAPTGDDHDLARHVELHGPTSWRWAREPARASWTGGMKHVLLCPRPRYNRPRLPLGWRHCIGLAHAHQPRDRRRHRRSRHEQPARQRARRGGVARARLACLATLGSGPRRARASSCAPKAAGSTPASTSKRCSARRGSKRCSAPTAAAPPPFAAVYECEVPVIAAVHGYCLGGGIGLVGNADIVIASTRRDLRTCPKSIAARSAPRRTSRGSCRITRCAPWCTRARRPPPPSSTPTGRSCASFPPAELRAAAREVAADIAKKSPTVIRAAKQSLNGIDPIDVKRSYRYEQGFTFELNLAGVADEARDAFVAKKDPKFSK